MQHRQGRPRWAAVLCTVAALAGADAFAQTRPVPSPPGLDDWRADLAFVREELPRRHVEPWHSLTPAEFATSIDRLEADLGGLTEHEIVVRLAEIVAALGDGHSRLTLVAETRILTGADRRKGSGKAR